MFNIAIIPVRKNSKRLKNKNILNFNGSLLFEHTLKTAINSKSFNKIIVTTDIDIQSKIKKNTQKKLFLINVQKNIVQIKARR